MCSWLPSWCFHRCVRWDAELKRKNQQGPNERGRDNIALFSFCIPHRSHSSQEMLSLPLLPLPVLCQIVSLDLNPAMEIWQMKRDTHTHTPEKKKEIGSPVFSDCFKVKWEGFKEWPGDPLWLLKPITVPVKICHILPFSSQQQLMCQDQKRILFCSLWLWFVTWHYAPDSKPTVTQISCLHVLDPRGTGPAGQRALLQFFHLLRSERA